MLKAPFPVGQDVSAAFHVSKTRQQCVCVCVITPKHTKTRQQRLSWQFQVDVHSGWHFPSQDDWRSSFTACLHGVYRGCYFPLCYQLLFVKNVKKNNRSAITAVTRTAALNNEWFLKRLHAISLISAVYLLLPAQCAALLQCPSWDVLCDKHNFP